jgi:hypothetical protein
MPHREQGPADKAAGAEEAASQRAASDYILEVGHARMNAAYDSGEAVPFAHSVPWLARYDGSWWVVYERGWLRVTDEPTVADLDQRAAQMTEAEAKKGRDAAIRAAVTSGGADRASNPASRPPFGD